MIEPPPFISLSSVQFMQPSRIAEGISWIHRLYLEKYCLLLTRLAGAEQAKNQLMYRNFHNFCNLVDIYRLEWRCTYIPEIAISNFNRFPNKQISSLKKRLSQKVHTSFQKKKKPGLHFLAYPILVLSFCTPAHRMLMTVTISSKLARKKEKQLKMGCTTTNYIRNAD